MKNQYPLIFIHGLQGSSQGFKATFLRQRFPHIHTPDFDGELDQRMEALTPLLLQQDGWVIIGSSFGGLMGTLFTTRHPAHVHKLILLAPAFTNPFFDGPLPPSVDTPTTIYHGYHDTVVPLEPVRARANQIFTRLSFHAVDDDHALHATVQTINWESLLDRPSGHPQSS